jgi:hypothetical protein
MRRVGLWVVAAIDCTELLHGLSFAIAAVCAFVQFG